MQKITFTEDDCHYIVNVPVSAPGNEMLMRMWVAYDIGNRISYYDYSEVERGYYLYCSFEELSEEYAARIISVGPTNCRLYLGAVKRRSKGWHRDFSELAGRIATAALKNVYPHLEFKWDELWLSEWSGRGSGVGMWRDFYKIVLPRKEWVA